MIRDKLEELIGKIDDTVYDKALLITEHNIKSARIKYKMKTYADDYLIMLISAITVLRRKKQWK